MMYGVVAFAVSHTLTPRYPSGLEAASPSIDKKAVSDAYVYLLGRDTVIRKEHVDKAEPGVTYNVIKYNPLRSADFVNPQS